MPIVVFREAEELASKGKGLETQQPLPVLMHASTLVPERSMLGGSKGNSAAKPYVEEDWNNSDDDDESSQVDELEQDYFLDAGRGMNLLARLKGGGGGQKRKAESDSIKKKKKKKKKKTKSNKSLEASTASASPATAISLSYAEEAWDKIEDDVLNGLGKRGKRSKKKKEKEHR